MRRAAILTVVAALLATAPARAEGIAAARAVSLDFCADQYLLALAEPAQIAGLSRDAGRDFSYLRDAAGGFPRIRPEAEELLRIGPDLGFRFWGGDAARLPRSGVRIVTLDYAADFDGVRANIRHVADALGRHDAGESLIASMDARLDALAARELAPRRALYVTPGGLTAGRGTMVDAVLRAAGVVNIAASEGAVGWPALPAERLIERPPELIVAGFFTSNSERINHWSAARHPALRRLFRDVPTVRLAPDVVACPGWFAVDAAEAIADAALATSVSDIAKDQGARQ